VSTHSRFVPSGKSCAASIANAPKPTAYNTPATIDANARIAVLSHSRPSGTWGDVWIAMPPDPERYAARLYESLRRAEAMDVDVIAIESPGADDPAWAAILNRLRRATA